MYPALRQHHCSPRAHWWHALTAGDTHHCAEDGRTWEVTRQHKLTNQGHGRWSRTSWLGWTETTV